MFKVRKWKELNNNVFQKSEDVQKKAIDDIADARRKLKEERERIKELTEQLKKMPKDTDQEIIDALKEEL